MVDGRRPYVVPMNFGFDLWDGVLELYCHSALEGRKIEILRRNPEVCFEMDCGHKLVEAKAACSYGFASNFCMYSVLFRHRCHLRQVCLLYWKSCNYYLLLLYVLIV